VDAVVLIVADGAARDGYVIFGSDLQFITVLDGTAAQIAAAVCLVIEVVIAGIMCDGRTIGHVHGCAAFDIDGVSAAHPYRCVAQVQRTAVHIDVAGGHGTVIITEQCAPDAAITGIDVTDPAASAIVHSPGKPAEKGNEKEKRDCTGTTDTMYSLADPDHPAQGHQTHSLHNYTLMYDITFPIDRDLPCNATFSCKPVNSRHTTYYYYA